MRTPLVPRASGRRLLWTTRVLRLGLIALSLCAAASGVRAESREASGSWSANDGAPNGTWRATLETAGEDIVGEMSVEGGGTELRGGKVSGSMHGASIEFGIVYDEREGVTFVGSVDPATGAVSGTFTGPDSLSGSWHGTMGRAAPPSP